MPVCLSGMPMCGGGMPVLPQRHVRLRRCPLECPVRRDADPTRHGRRPHAVAAVQGEIEAHHKVAKPLGSGGEIDLEELQ